MNSEAAIKSEIRVSHDLSGITSLRIRDISRNHESIIFHGKYAIDMRLERRKAV